MEPTTISIGATKHQEFGRPKTHKVSCGGVNGYGPTLSAAKEQLAATLVNRAQSSDARVIVLTNEQGDMVMIRARGTAEAITFDLEMYRRTDMSDDKFEREDSPGVARWEPSSVTMGGNSGELSTVCRWAREWLTRAGA